MTRPAGLVLFDIDGTLLRRAGPHHKAALIEGIRRVTGIATTLEGVDTSGMLDRDLIREMLRARGVSKHRIRLAMRELVSACQASYLEGCAADLRDCVCNGVPEFLENLQRQGVALGVVTGNLTKIGWKKLELAQLRSYFSFGAFAEDGTTRARLARIALRRARSTGLAVDNARVSLIGDHPNDIAAARANGFQAIAVATGLMRYDDLKAFNPDILVNDLTELATERLLAY